MMKELILLYVSKNLTSISFTSDNKNNDYVFLFFIAVIKILNLLTNKLTERKRRLVLQIDEKCLLVMIGSVIVFFKE